MNRQNEILRKIFKIALLIFVAASIPYGIVTRNGMIDLLNQVQTRYRNNVEMKRTLLVKIETLATLAKVGTDQQNRGQETLAEVLKAKGIQGTLVWIQSQKPVDSILYENAQRAVTIDYNRLVAGQTTLNDLLGSYTDLVTQWPSSWIAWISGFSLDNIEPYTTALISPGGFATGSEPTPSIPGGDQPPDSF